MSVRAIARSGVVPKAELTALSEERNPAATIKNIRPKIPIATKSPNMVVSPEVLPGTSPFVGCKAGCARRAARCRGMLSLIKPSKERGCHLAARGRPRTAKLARGAAADIPINGLINDCSGRGAT